MRALALLLVMSAWLQPSNAQSSGKTAVTGEQGVVVPSRVLTVATVLTLPTQVASRFRQPLSCDQDGNLYLESDEFGFPGIHKISPKGEQLAIFQATSNPDLRLIDLSQSFALAQDSELYELVYPHGQITRYVVVYRSDGSFKANIKLEPGFGWVPSALAVFPKGQMLITGQRYDVDPRSGMMWPFTGIFSSDGTLLKEIQLEDDTILRDKAKAGDVRFKSSLNPTSNRAISFSRMELGNDGNVYLMRAVTPAIFYAISPGGETVRRFSVDPGDPSYRPIAMHISGRRIAVLFSDSEYRKIMKIVDLEGQQVATYSADGNIAVGNTGATKKTRYLGGAFACYFANPDRFVFLGTDEHDKLEFRTAEGR